jgi:hypothetical protein
MNMKNYTLSIITVLLCSTVFELNAQVWLGTTVPTNTNDDVSIGPSVLSNGKLNISSSWGINSCSYTGKPALNIEWSGPSLFPNCPNGMSGSSPDIVNITNKEANSSGTGFTCTPLLRLTGSGGFALGGNPVDQFFNSFHKYTGFNDNVQFKSKLRINSTSLSLTNWSNGTFPYSFSVDNGDSRFVGKVQIGSMKPSGAFTNYKLGVDGDIVCKKMVVQISDWADFVFSKDYQLKSLKEVEEYILQNKHLPAMPSEAIIISDGLDLGNVVKLQQQKIEELTLYLIEQQKQIELLQQKIK